MTWRFDSQCYPFFSSPLTMEKFTSGMIDVTGRNFFSPVHSRYIKFMEHYAIVMWNRPLLAGVTIPCLLPSFYYITDISSVAIKCAITKILLHFPTDRLNEQPADRQTERPLGLRTDRQFRLTDQVTKQLTPCTHSF